MSTTSSIGPEEASGTIASFSTARRLLATWPRTAVSLSERRGPILPSRTPNRRGARAGDRHRPGPRPRARSRLRITTDRSTSTTPRDTTGHDVPAALPSALHPPPLDSRSSVSASRTVRLDCPSSSDPDPGPDPAASAAPLDSQSSDPVGAGALGDWQSSRPGANARLRARLRAPPARPPPTGTDAGCGRSS